MSLAAAANAGNLSFEEFAAITSRAKAKNATQEQKGSAAAAPEKNDDKSKLRSMAASSIGDFLEMPQVQAFVIIMMVLDTFAALAQLLMRLEAATTAKMADGGLNMNVAPSSDSTLLQDDELPFSLMRIINKYLVSSAVLGNVLSSFSDFSLLFFALEIFSIVVIFNFAVFGHIGYTLDCLVVGFQIWTEYTGDGLQCRLLNLLRYWRLARFVSALVSIEKDAHEQSRQLLVDKDGKCRQLEGNARRIQEELDKEKEARQAVDEMLAIYKEEVDTLNEALKIAAMDIAEVAEADDDLLLSDDEDEGAEGGDENDFVDASASSYDKARNKEVLMREARRDANNPAAAAQRKAQSGGHTFHVHEDGTFDYN